MANMPLNNMTDVWNTAGTVYSAMKMNVTNAASSGTDGSSPVSLMSKLVEMQVGGVPKFFIDKFGNVVTAGTLTTTGVVSSGANLPSADDSAALGASSQAWSDLFLANGGVINWNAGDVTIVHGVNSLAFAGASTGYSFDTLIKPAANDGSAIGAPGSSWSDLFLANGGVINWNSGDVTITHAANSLAFAGAANGYTFDNHIKPSINDGAALGIPGTGWSDLLLADGGVVNWASGNMTLTHTTGVLTVGNGDLRISATAGTTATSVVTVGGTQTLTSKTLTNPAISDITASTLALSGNLTAGGDIAASVSMTSPLFTSPTTQVILSSTLGAGNVLLRPNGSASTVGQLSVSAAGNALAAGTIVANTILGTKAASGNTHLYFYGPANEVRGIIYTNAGAAGHLQFQESGGHTWYMTTAGNFQSPGQVVTGNGAARMQTDANVIGSIWTNMAGGAYSDFYSAVAVQIEQRCSAYMASRLTDIQVNRVAGTYSGNTPVGGGGYTTPAGTVVYGYSRGDGQSGSVYGLYYVTLQIYDNIHGWRNMGG